MRRDGRKSVVALVFALALLLIGCAVSPSDVAVAGVADRSSAASQADAATRAALRLQLAVGYYEQGQFSVAVEEAGKALQAQPDFAQAYGVRALAYSALEQWPPAEADFTRALALAPADPDLANNYGWFLCNAASADRHAEAMRYFEQALNNPAYRHPGIASANAGVCSWKAGNLAQAEQFLLRGFQQAPASAMVNVNLGKFYFDRAEFEKAHVHIGLAAKNEVLKVDALWLAIKIERKLGNQAAENELAVQLRGRYPSSSEYAAYRRGAFDE